MVIYCEGHTVKSVIHKDTLAPEFETMAIFYRKNPRKHLTIQVRCGVVGELVDSQLKGTGVKVGIL